METSLDIKGHTIYNVKNPLEADQAVNKRNIDKIKNDHHQMISFFNMGKLSNPSGVNLNMLNNKIINLKKSTK